MMVLSRTQFVCTLLFVCIAFTSQAEDYVRVTASKGDGALSLLRRYELDQYSCNLQHFYRINQMSPGSFLQLGKEYSLPIHVHQYNGRSIGSTLGISDWDTRERIQEYNERMLALNLRTASFQEDLVLWVPHHELNCPHADRSVTSPTTPIPVPVPGPASNPDFVPLTPSKVSYPIFGPAFEEVPLFPSPQQQGMVYYLVSGHGGPDPGAIGKSGKHTLCEDEYAYDVTLRLARLLIQDGATVYMITRDKDDGIRDQRILPCDTDEKNWDGSPMHNDQKPRLTQRANIINALYDENIAKGIPSELQRVVIIHIDSRAKSQRVDVFSYHQKDREESQQMAQNIMNTFQSAYKKYQPNRQYFGKVIYRDLFMIENTKPSTVYIELGNIRNNNDQRRLLETKNRNYLARWLLDGLRK